MKEYNKELEEFQEEKEVEFEIKEISLVCDKCRYKIGSNTCLSCIEYNGGN